MSNSDVSVTPEWVTTKQAAEMLGCSESQALVLGHAGVVTTNGARRRRQFDAASIRAYLALFRSPLASPREPGEERLAVTEQPELLPVPAIPAAPPGCDHESAWPHAMPRRMVLTCPEGYVAGFAVRFADGTTVVRTESPCNGLQVVPDARQAAEMFPGGLGQWRLSFLDSAPVSTSGQTWPDGDARFAQ